MVLCSKIQLRHFHVKDMLMCVCHGYGGRHHRHGCYHFLFIIPLPGLQLTMPWERLPVIKMMDS